MIKIAICDDNNETLMMLESLLSSQYHDLIRIHTFTTAFSLMTYLQDEAKGDTDLLLMDIELAQDNGIEVADTMQKQFPKLKVIFITGYIDYARYIFKAEPMDFIVKPVEKKRLYEAIDRALLKITVEKEQMIQIHYKGELLKLDTDQIFYLETIQKVTYVHTRKKEYATRKRIDEMMKELPQNFVRCHQSFVINMDKIVYFAAGQAELANGQRIPVSRNRYRVTKETFMKYLEDGI